MYIHQREGWPDFIWDEARVSGMLADARHLQGRLLGRMETLGFQWREEATLQTLTQDVLKTCEIVGKWGHPLKGRCQEEILPQCKKKSVFSLAEV